MVHQCVSEDLWFRNMLGIDVQAPPLPQQETRLEFIRRYAKNSGKRLAALEQKNDAWWEEKTNFFDVRSSRAGIMTRPRIIAASRWPCCTCSDAPCTATPLRTPGPKGQVHCAR